MVKDSDLDLDLEANDLDLDLDSVVKDSDLDITCLQTTAVQLCAQQQTPDSCLTFWSQHERDLNKLHQLAMSVLSVPAISAAVERIFSHGGLFMRPHRARMSDKLLSTLVFLKCNM